MSGLCLLAVLLQIARVAGEGAPAGTPFLSRGPILGPTPAETPVLDLDAAKWSTWSAGRFSGLRTTRRGLTFDFPTARGAPTINHIDYVTSNYPVAPLSGKASLTAAFQVTTIGNPHFRFDTAADNRCAAPQAGVRLFFAQKHYSVSGEAAAQYQRWWSNPIAYVLAPGAATLTVPLTPDQWSSVYGVKGNASMAARAGFARAKAEVGHIGLTFGGGCFFGHGVAASGRSARFTLTGYQIR